MSANITDSWSDMIFALMLEQRKMTINRKTTCFTVKFCMSISQMFCNWTMMQKFSPASLTYMMRVHLIFIFLVDCRLFFRFFVNSKNVTLKKLLWCQLGFAILHIASSFEKWGPKVIISIKLCDMDNIYKFKSKGYLILTWTQVCPFLPYFY